MTDFGEGRRYNSFVGYYKKKYGERLQKIVLDTGFTCPNRDGKVGRGGCTYCDNAAFHPAYSTPGKPISGQIDEGIEFHKVRYRNTAHYLAYFQSFSNTYAPLPRLKELYEAALAHPAVVGIVIGTRPDCVDEEKLDYIADLKDGKVLKDWRRTLGGNVSAGAGSGDGGHEDGMAMPGWRRTLGCPASAQDDHDGDNVVKGLDNGIRELTAPIVTVEYGIESCYDSTLQRINRGHDFACAQNAVKMNAERGIETGAHFILGLPGETRDMMLESCREINALALRSVKFHQLQIVKGTRMEKEFAEHPEDFIRFTLDDYLDFFVDMLERLRPDLYIERFAGEVPPRFVNETPWGLIRNVELLRLLEKRLEERATCQGRLY